MSLSPEMSQKISKAVENAFEALTSGASLSSMQGIAPEKIEALYALGHRSYLQRDYKKAEEIFSYAHRLDHFHPRITQGLAAAYKMQGKFKKALAIYSLAGLLDMTDPFPSFYAAECFFALGDYEPCAQALDAAREIAEDNRDEDDDDEDRGDMDKLIEKIDHMKIILAEQKGEKSEKESENVRK